MRVRIVSKSSAARGRDIKPSRDTGIILFPSRRGTLFASIFGKAGGCTRTRTLDPLIKSQLLYQLSYAPAAGGAVYIKGPAACRYPLPAPEGSGRQVTSA